MSDPGIRACFCASVDDPADPERHEIGCLHAEVIRAHAALSRGLYFNRPPNTDLRRALWGPNRRPSPPAIPGGCYEASWGWVHVKPGCHCPR